MMFSCVILLILSSFMEAYSEHLKVFGPEAPLVAVAGEDLVLPCYVKPSTSAVDMTVEWFRPYVEDSLVHLYKDHGDSNENQAQSYRGRTMLFKDELQKGNASLKLSAVQVSDGGKYKCFIEDKSWSDDITLNVTVEAQGSHPVITMESYDSSGGVNLMCDSRGWNPAPAVLWLDRKGDTLPAEETQIHRETDGLSVKRRITVYDNRDSNRFYCRLLQQHHMIEAEVIINSEVFDAWKWNVDASKRNVWISVSACFLAVGLILTAVICYKKVKKMEAEMEKEKQYAELQRQRVEDEFLKKKKTFAVDVTLDPDTAHTAGGQEVTHKDTRQETLTNPPERFTDDHSVVGKQSFSSGRFYYEVQVIEKTGWTLGVVRENVNRKERLAWKPQYGFWTVSLLGNHYRANADSDVPLPLREKVEKVGVFVDYEEGLVSFYDVESRSHIYSFTGQSFTENLYPYLFTWENEVQ